MDTTHGFSLLREQEIAEAGCTARLYRHDRTGAQLVSVACPDENKVFGVTLRTPPADSTGVAHILEHSVLCGSRRYPVKEPFVELLKGSLHTFLNAFTYPDKTCYPVASTNLADFRNLVDVYLDAVFHPLITEDIFRQEGWHYELDAPEGPLSRKGVVYNEMKGAYSSPDGVLHEACQQALFPDTPYGLDSGGDPEVIPELTYEAFKAFHTTYYHPANARFWFYGDDPEAQRLERLGAFLEEFGPWAVDSRVPVQEPLPAPRRVEKPFDAGDDPSGMVTLNWLLPEVTDRPLALALEVLEELLIGLPSSPLRRALMESGLGEDLAGTGLENELRQMFFSTGLRGVDPQDEDAVQALVLETLERLAAGGPTREMVEAALNTVEFDLRENNTGRFPRGLSMMLASLTNWLYDADPFEPLAFEAPLAALKARLDAGEPVFQKLIRTHLLDNPHRVTVVLRPDPGLGAAREAREAAGLAAVLAGMDEAARAGVMARARELARLQEAPDSPEALATIPRLDLADIPREEKPIPTRSGVTAAAMTRLHDIPARGIIYLDAGLDLTCVPGHLLPLVPLFGRALFEMGTAREDFAELSMRIARKTGGMGPEVFTSTALDAAAPVARLFLHGKATAANAPEMLAILHDVLFNARFDDRERFRLMVGEEKARMEQSLVPSGHMVVLSRLRARASLAGWAAERMGGLEALEAVRALAREVDSDWPGVLARLEELRGVLVRAGNLVLNATGDAADLAAFEGPLAEFAAALPAGAAPAAAGAPAPLAPREGLTIPARVNYVGKIVRLDEAGWRFHGAQLAAVKYARMGYLWEKVRVRGGAYGAFCVLDRFAGTLAFASYRDPALAGTLAAFDGAGAFFRELDLSADELAKAVIGAVGDMDAYLLPDAQGLTALLRELTGDTPARRQTMREELLGATQADFRAFGECLEGLMAEGEVVVLGAAEAIGASGLDFSVTRVL